MFVILCLVAGFAALAGMSSVLAALILGVGMLGLLSATGFGALALGAGLWAAFLAFARPASAPIA